ncbi:hypothetical protein LSCM1_00308 [Leishmania martiniquensis]|uniref:Uncharacterized protein n=1 Tax=Leishmania martiniquensis TaxID=1580590 RepID=A0A836GU16_9TRYP|nr:hypothetical protein LSCM1_00308 [Leishmania martiniquensis]
MDRAPFEDQDLVMAARESAQHAINVQNEAYRQALSELAGELYVKAYEHSIKQTMSAYAAQWNISGDVGGPANAIPNLPTC